MIPHAADANFTVRRALTTGMVGTQLNTGLSRAGPPRPHNSGQNRLRGRSLWQGGLLWPAPGFRGPGERRLAAYPLSANAARLLRCALNTFGQNEFGHTPVRMVCPKKPAVPGSLVRAGHPVHPGDPDPQRQPGGHRVHHCRVFHRSGSGLPRRRPGQGQQLAAILAAAARRNSSMTGN